MGPKILMNLNIGGVSKFQKEKEEREAKQRRAEEEAAAEVAKAVDAFESSKRQPVGVGGAWHRGDTSSSSSSSSTSTTNSSSLYIQQPLSTESSTTDKRAIASVSSQHRSPVLSPLLGSSTSPAFINAFNIPASSSSSSPSPSTAITTTTTTSTSPSTTTTSVSLSGVGMLLNRPRFGGSSILKPNAASISSTSSNIGHHHHVDEEEDDPEAEAAALLARGEANKKNLQLDSLMMEFKRKQEDKNSGSSNANTTKNSNSTLNTNNSNTNRKPQAAALPPGARLVYSAADSDPTTTNVYVGNLAPTTTEEMLLETFSCCLDPAIGGKITSVKVMWPRTEEEKQRGRNKGFVLFEKRADAEKAIATMLGTMFDGVPIHLGWAKGVRVGGSGAASALRPAEMLGMSTATPSIATVPVTALMIPTEIKAAAADASSGTRHDTTSSSTTSTSISAPESSSQLGTAEVTSLAQPHITTFTTTTGTLNSSNEGMSVDAETIVVSSVSTNNTNTKMTKTSSSSHDAPSLSSSDLPAGTSSTVTTPSFTNAIIVTAPSDEKIRKIIDTWATYVVRDGTSLESILLQKLQEEGATAIGFGSNSSSSSSSFAMTTEDTVLTSSFPPGTPLVSSQYMQYFEWLLHPRSDGAVYYRWRVYSLLQGDSLTAWRAAPFQMLENGPMWIPPPLLSLPSSSSSSSSVAAAGALDTDTATKSTTNARRIRRDSAGALIEEETIEGDDSEGDEQEETKETRGREKGAMTRRKRDTTSPSNSVGSTTSSSSTSSFESWSNQELHGTRRRRKRDTGDEEHQHLTLRLPQDEKTYLQQLLATNSLRRNHIFDVMVFAMDHAEYADEVAGLIVSPILSRSDEKKKGSSGSSSSNSNTSSSGGNVYVHDNNSNHKKPKSVRAQLGIFVAILYILSDILQNAAAPVRNASAYRALFQASLPRIFEALREYLWDTSGDTARVGGGGGDGGTSLTSSGANHAHGAGGGGGGAVGRVTIAAVRDRCMGVLRTWEKASIFPPLFLSGLESTLLRTYSIDELISMNEELRAEKLQEEREREGANTNNHHHQDKETKVAASRLVRKELKEKCKRAGLSSHGGSLAMTARLDFLRKYTRAKLGLESGLGGGGVAAVTTGDEAASSSSSSSSSNPVVPSGSRRRRLPRVSNVHFPTQEEAMNAWSEVVEEDNEAAAAAEEEEEKEEEKVGVKGKETLMGVEEVEEHGFDTVEGRPTGLGARGNLENK